MSTTPRRGGRRRSGGALGGATETATPRRDLQLSADLGITGLREALTEAGCMNVVERAAELVLHGRTLFYRSTPDEAIVTVTLAEAVTSDA